jgi:hypothetical protein
MRPFAATEVREDLLVRYLLEDGSEEAFAHLLGMALTMAGRIEFLLILLALGGVAGNGQLRAQPPAGPRGPAAQALNPPLPEPSAPSDRLKPIGAVLLPSPGEERMPQDLAAERFGDVMPEFQPMGYSRSWAMQVRPWEAPGLCHRPLYFADEKLERYGHSYGWAQPAYSAAHFGGRVVAWPALLLTHPPHECIYTLGHGRPGSCPP